MCECEGAKQHIHQLEGGRLGELVEVLDDASRAHQPWQFEQSGHCESCGGALGRHRCINLRLNDFHFNLHQLDV